MEFQGSGTQGMMMMMMMMMMMISECMELCSKDKVAIQPQMSLTFSSE